MKKRFISGNKKLIAGVLAVTMAFSTTVAAEISRAQDEAGTAGTTTTYQLGDVTRDGFVKLDDAQLALKAALLLEELDAEEQYLADVTEEYGKVTLADAQLILRKALLLGEIPDKPDMKPTGPAVEPSETPSVTGEPIVPSGEPVMPSGEPVASEAPASEAPASEAPASELPDLPVLPTIPPLVMESVAPPVRTMSPQGPKLPTVPAVDYEVSGVAAVMLATNGAVEDDGIFTFTNENKQNAMGIAYQWPFSGRTDLVQSVSEAGVTREMINKVDADRYSSKGDYIAAWNAGKLTDYTFPRPKWSTGISISFWSKQKWQYSTQSNGDRILVIKSSKYCDEHSGGNYDGYGGPVNSHGQGCDFALVLYSNGSIVLESGDESANGMRTQNYIAGQDDQWTHYTVTIANDWITVYVNGQEMVYQNVDFYKDAASECFNGGFMTRYNATGMITREMIDNDPRGYYTVKGISKTGPWILPTGKDDVPENYETNFETTLIGSGIYSNPDSVMGYKLLMELLTQDKVEIYLGGVESCCVNSKTYGEYEYKTPTGSQVTGLTYFESELTAGEVAKVYEDSVAELGSKLFPGK